MVSSFPSGRRHRLLLLLLPLISAAAAPLIAAHGEHSPACPFSTPAGSDHEDHHQHHEHDHDRDHFHDHHYEHRRQIRSAKLPEELAEEEDLMLEGFDNDHHHHHHHDHHHHHPNPRHHDHQRHHPRHHSHGDRPSALSPIGLWVRAMGCSLLVSLASLICLAILPVMLLQGKPSKSLVDSLAVFGAGAMLGDAFLHQLPHAFGGEHSHSHEHHEHHLEHGHSHAHSLEDLSVGLSILCGIVLFFLVEKVVRYVQDNSVKGAYGMGHGHHHHHKRHDKLKDDGENHDKSNSKFDEPKDTLNYEHHGCQNDENHTEHETLLRKRATCSGATNDDKEDLNAGNGLTTKKSSLNKATPPSSLVFGYLNLFSDGVHNFTDGMALGSAFLLHGSVGGWSRTLFLLAHELPQEVGDFGILVRSGFSISKALLFNFLSALVALAGTALALVLGKDPGQSSLIEGFTAGGFIYIAVAGVLPEMNDGKTTFKSTAIQLASLILGMGVALCISLIE